MMRNVLSAAIFSLTFVFVGCADVQRSQNMAMGAAGLGAVGAGVGALVGEVSDRIDSGAAIVVGAVAGLGIGTAVGAVYTDQKRDAVLSANEAVINDNRDVILGQETEINSLRESLINESYDIEPDTALVDDVYEGATLGNPF